MKFFLAFLTLAVLAQASLGASIPRSKRSERNKIDYMKELLYDLESQMKSVLGEMPKTNAYKKYELKIENILKMYNVEEEYCLDKIMNISKKIVFLKHDLEEEGTEESLKVRGLIRKYNAQGRGKELSAAVENADDPKFSEALNSF